MTASIRTAVTECGHANDNGNYSTSTSRLLVNIKFLVPACEQMGLSFEHSDLYDPHVNAPNPFSDPNSAINTTEEATRQRKIRPGSTSCLSKDLKIVPRKALQFLQQRLDRISTSTKELLEKKRKLRLDPNATHLAQVLEHCQLADDFCLMFS
ncbi:hypothetical protein KIN20_007563 [Parelaphostrongylus tenuis]|uniref:Uncharacterized protein n=1 Tax=Parelaphostrongylus tenuis TaxID=148309 RepID=A0AAD5M5P2_PARTN|nr:hypothetical protein KIN20_007563 [Parelaphostrongylus tenuis]